MCMTHTQIFLFELSASFCPRLLAYATKAAWPSSESWRSQGSLTMYLPSLSMERLGIPRAGPHVTIVSIISMYTYVNLHGTQKGGISQICVLAGIFEVFKERPRI